MQAPQKQITQASIAMQIRGRSFLDSPVRYFKNKDFSLSISLMKSTYLFYNKPVYLVYSIFESAKAPCYCVFWYAISHHIHINRTFFIIFVNTVK